MILIFPTIIFFRFLLGDSLSHLDCEVLPKLHHVRVSASMLKSFFIPSHLVGIWRYLNNAYNDEIFHKSCPPDQEIVLHWASRPDTPKLSYELYASLTRNTPRFSFDVPAVAIPINIWINLFILKQSIYQVVLEFENCKSQYVEKILNQIQKPIKKTLEEWKDCKCILHEILD